MFIIYITFVIVGFFIIFDNIPKYGTPIFDELSPDMDFVSFVMFIYGCCGLGYTIINKLIEWIF